MSFHGLVIFGFNIRILDKSEPISHSVNDWNGNRGLGNESLSTMHLIIASHQDTHTQYHNDVMSTLLRNKRNYNITTKKERYEVTKGKIVFTKG